MSPMPRDSGHAVPRALAAAIILTFSLAWGASSAYAVLAEKPRGAVYVVEPWPGNETLVGGGCLGGSPVLVASQSGLFTFETLIYTPNWSVVIEGFNPQAFCTNPEYVVVAGSYNGTPALALVRGPHDVTVLSLTGAGPASLNAVKCRDTLVAAAGSSMEGTIVLRLTDGSAEAWLVRYLAPTLSVLPYAGNTYVLTASGVIALEPNGTARLYTVGLANATWEDIIEGPGGAWLTGSATFENTSWAAIAPLNGGEALLLRAEGYDGLVIDARRVGQEWIAYYRPGSYWDCLARIGGSAAHGVKLLWTGPHEVVSAHIDEGGYAVTATLVTGARRYAVLACTGSVEEAHYWLGDSSIMHASLIPVTERLLVGYRQIPKPSVAELEGGRISLSISRIQAGTTAIAPHFEGASLVWGGPLAALTYAALSIVLASALWRGFLGGGS